MSSYPDTPLTFHRERHVSLTFHIARLPERVMRLTLDAQCRSVVARDMGALRLSATGRQEEHALWHRFPGQQCSSWTTTHACVTRWASCFWTLDMLCGWRLTGGKGYRCCAPPPSGWWRW